MGPGLTSLCHAAWYEGHPLGWLLAPASWGFRAAVSVRRWAYLSGLASSRRFAAPVIVVGNISVGGTGKTPLVVWLARLLREHGLRPGIACRGYLGTAARWPQQVRSDSDADAVGDEAVVLARRTGCPVAAGPDRIADVAALVRHAACDVVVCDDGLQHYALARDVEIAVVDGVRRHGNGRCLPAGPLREPISRLAGVDLVVVHGAPAPGEHGMRLIAGDPRSVRDDRVTVPLRRLARMRVHAVCGIGHPARFFADLRRLGVEVLPHAFPDHHRFRREDLDFDDDLTVLMTEKDAVKCRRFAGPEHWYLPVEAEVAPELAGRVLDLVGEAGARTRAA